MLRILPLFLVPVIIGCGDGSSGSPAPTTVDDRAAVTVITEEYRYLPATLSMRGASSVRIDNTGGLAHTWTVLSEPIAAETELTPELTLAEARAEPGQSSVIDLAGIAPGTYQIVCAIPGHFSAGMVGELVVE